MEKMQAAIGYLLFMGVSLSFVIVAIGGTLYLWQHGADVVSYRLFSSDAIIFKSLTDIFRAAWHFSALGIIQLGLLTLVLIQLLRVALTAWFFVQMREKIFTWVSLFVLGVLVYSLLWQ
jgi:uncharacterized membrane protein